MRLLTILVPLAVFGLAACDSAAPGEAPSPLAVSADARPGSAGADGLAAARRGTARYHRLAVAENAGYVPVSPCVESPAGGMGYHYGSPALLFDGGALDPSAPEALLYEPQKNGQLRLVGVEYIVSFDDEPRPENGGVAPELFGRTFHPSEAAGGWALHAWVWQNNPAGMFEDWNPTVSCDHA